MRGRRWEQAWRTDVGPQVNEVLTAAQAASAAQAEAYIAAVLAELEIPAEVPTILNIDALVGVAGDGREVESLTYGAIMQAVDTFHSSATADLSTQAAEATALADAQAFLDSVTTTILADTARAAEAAATAQRPWVEGYVRMLDPKNPCSRCIILAGRFYLYNKGFDRHVKCRCVHIPASEDVAGNMLTNPHLYFESLSAAEQDRIFTKAGAEAVRLGADPSQVVNARRGMYTAQQNPRGWIPKGRMEAVRMFGRDAFITTEGVTKHGIYGKTRGKKPVRLMPESILSIATDREDAIRLLKVYGYLI